ncbi:MULTISPECIES: AMP-binding protein [Gordonia]|uniref:Putative fatty-acid--CoA ligase n=1 Tax=Gordonia sihwensis NBRC 108236 TaxID=1223544 RepID=L7LMV8_9ACTN|nr:MULTISPECIES: AMP-binding protein [Gordonia]AUH68552.1 acyl-CoA synthetase [Gordonia sp. YC-JH1]GAC62224.1 putative fatty-acid--CoA ligase [Gordonia sihwensis NBRC 108236]
MTLPARSGLDSPLTPLRFLDRAVEVHPDKEAAVDGGRRRTYRELAAEATRLAQALRASGIGEGDRVAYLATNSLEMLAAHFAVPLAGGVLVAVNTRLAPAEVRYICNHSGARLLVGDAPFLEALAGVEFETVREVVETPSVDGEYTGAGDLRYDELTARGSDNPIPWEVDDENSLISINYTSGTTGEPKGVMYTHRGAYLASLGNVLTQGFGIDTRYLWTLPMFHCNGWCGPWSVTAVAGTHVCLRAVRGDDMWRLIDTELVTQMSGAPTVLTTLATAGEAHRMDRPLTIATAGAPPSPTIIRAIRNLGIELVHVYGLTETYGPYSVCEPSASWSSLSGEELAVRMARQGVGMITADRLRVVLPEPAEDGTLVDVEPDGVMMGEIVMRGNVVMKGYFEDPERTAEAFAGGWFHSGDLGVMHPDGYVQLLDRAKDVIISGGENISTIEVEQAVVSHPAIVDVAVVGVPDDKWGERPKAYAVRKPGEQLTEAEVIAHVKSRIAGYKAPREVEFVDDLPKTSTGKIRKNELRDAAWGDSTMRIQG